MKLAIMLVILVIFIAGCSTIKTTHTISGTQELVLNAQDLQQLGMTSGGNEQDLQQLEITSDGSYCRTEEYATNDHAPLAQYSICSYTINSVNDTQVVLELKKFTNFEDLNGTYQYESQHLRSVQGLISQNDFGDQSRFYLNNVNDFGGSLTDPSISYYALYITKDGYLIYITSKGSKEAKEYIAKIGHLILSKFG